MLWTKEHIVDITKLHSVTDLEVFLLDGRTIRGIFVDAEDTPDGFIIMATTMRRELHYSHVPLEDISFVSAIVKQKTLPINKEQKTHAGIKKN